MNRKYIKLIIIDGLFAAGMVCLYSPGIIGLSPLSQSTLKAALSIAIGVVAIPMFIYVNKVMLSEKQLSLLDKDEGNRKDKIVTVLNSCRQSKVLGSIVRSTELQMQRVENSALNFDRFVSHRFEKGSLSYQKFITVMESASKAMFDGYVQIANKMVMFDEAEYERLSGDEYLYDDIPDDIQKQKYALYNENLESARRILEKNEIILLGLDKLMTEISNNDDSDEDMNTTAREIDTLINQLEYYKTN